MKPYRHIFIDLDRTLWDFDTNSKDTLHDIYRDFALSCRGIESFSAFYDTYTEINHYLWSLYREEKITKEDLSVQRFSDTLEAFSVFDEGLAARMGEEYILRSPMKTRLFPGVVETLDYLKDKGYYMHIITNGFNEVQYTKMEQSGLKPYFRSIITSEEARSKKPDRAIFQYALQKSGAIVHQSLMVGDDPDVDIDGAIGVGMDQVLVDYNETYSSREATYRIVDFHELQKIL